jgi:cobalt/nickel transport system ATP-binding protein
VQLFSPTVWDEVLFGPLHLGIDKNEIVKRAEEALDLVGITRLRHRSPFTLSGGEKKRVALASILSIRPSVWLMDEPLASLDPKSQSRLIDFLSTACDRGETIVISTHDIALLSELADRVLVISEDHKLIADCNVQKLLKRTDFLLKHNLMHSHAHLHGKRRHSHKHMHDAGHKEH